VPRTRRTESQEPRTIPSGRIGRGGSGSDSALPLCPFALCFLPSALGSRLFASPVLVRFSCRRASERASRSRAGAGQVSSGLRAASTKAEPAGGRLPVVAPVPHDPCTSSRSPAPVIPGCGDRDTSFRGPGCAVARAVLFSPWAGQRGLAPQRSGGALYVRRTQDDGVETRGFPLKTVVKNPGTQHSRCPPCPAPLARPILPRKASERGTGTLRRLREPVPVSKAGRE
jgi:hypothetical protein